jgi:hypothetical protein
MALDVQTLATQMLAVALPLLKKDAEDAESFAKVEFTKIAHTVIAIGEQLANGEINQQQAVLLMNMQKLASQNVLLTWKGLSLLAVEAAINAALGVVKTAVNSAIGVVLL